MDARGIIPQATFGCKAISIVPTAVQEGNHDVGLRVFVRLASRPTKRETKFQLGVPLSPTNTVSINTRLLEHLSKLLHIPPAAVQPLTQRRAP